MKYFFYYFFWSVFRRHFTNCVMHVITPPDLLVFIKLCLVSGWLLTRSWPGTGAKAIRLYKPPDCVYVCVDVCMWMRWRGWWGEKVRKARACKINRWVRARAVTNVIIRWGRIFRVNNISRRHVEKQLSASCSGVYWWAISLITQQ